MQKTSKNKSTPKLAIHPHLKKARYSRIFKIKHAFPDKDMPDKKIFKSITKIDEDYAKLIFRDNGVGIENPKETTKNLGCEIIKNLTKQLNGKIKLIEHENGTGYSLVFPIKMKHTIHG